ncbi:MAG: pyruvate kinase [bacterium]
MRKTKIICTLGPATSGKSQIEALVRAGMDVARLNYSHGRPAEHRKTIRKIREVSSALSRPLAVMQDLAGPKIRIGDLPGGEIRLEAGQTVRLVTEQDHGASIPVSAPAVIESMQPGDPILLADGQIELKSEEVRPDQVLCRVVTGGVLTSRKGITLPTRSLDVPAFTEKDRADLRAGMEAGVDYVALSFVRDERDLRSVKSFLSQSRAQIPLIAKIEKHEALQNLDGILASADAIMVARGDLGVEIPLEEVPLVQKRLVEQANRSGKPAIIATQMLRSMVESPRPTRAEALDVANAVLDGADAVMLSEETAVGRYPVEAVRYMARIVEKAEGILKRSSYWEMPVASDSEAVGQSVCRLADELGAKAIVAPTQSGNTARAVSRFRPVQDILAFSPDPGVVRRLCLVWGVRCREVPRLEDTDDMIQKACEFARATGAVSTGDLVVIAAGVPVGKPGLTNLIKVARL